MRTMTLGASDLQVPVVAVGCMRLSGQDRPVAERFLGTALELGANFFDHADIYGGGECESRFGEAMAALGVARDRLILQSKCGIRPGTAYDFSEAHILASVDGSLRRLGTDYLDVLLLHRPDALAEPEEVASAFDRLHTAGKVRHFGVSNHNPGSIRLLAKAVQQPLVANQLQLSLVHAPIIAADMNMNRLGDAGVHRDDGVVNFCRLHDITIQPWSPFQSAQGVLLDNPAYPELNAKVDEIAARYGVANTTIALAWLMRHPARMQPVIGTMNKERLRDCIRAADVTLTRDEWYALYRAAGHPLP